MYFQMKMKKCTKIYLVYNIKRCRANKIERHLLYKIMQYKNHKVKV